MPIVSVAENAVIDTVSHDAVLGSLNAVIFGAFLSEPEDDTASAAAIA